MTQTPILQSPIRNIPTTTVAPTNTKQRTETRLVKEIMRASEAWLTMDDTLEQAAFALAHGSASELVVLDEAGHFAGVLTSSDLLRAAMPDIDEILAAGGSATEAFEYLIKKGRIMACLPILPLVNRGCETLAPADHIAKAATLLAHKECSTVPVVDNGQWIGTVWASDVGLAVLRGSAQ